MCKDNNCTCEAKQQKQPEEMSFVDRMVIEHDELDAKRKKLDKFIKSEKFKELDNENRFLLTAQLNSMANYQMILYRRIALNKTNKKFPL